MAKQSGKGVNELSDKWGPRPVSLTFRVMRGGHFLRLAIGHLPKPRVAFDAGFDRGRFHPRPASRCLLSPLSPFLETIFMFAYTYYGVT